MPEGPSLFILKEETARFVGQHIVDAGGNTSLIDPTRLLGQPIVSLRTWGKHFLIELPNLAIRIHFLLFGTYRINEQREGKPPGSTCVRRKATSSISTPARCARSMPTSTASTIGAPT